MRPAVLGPVARVIGRVGPTYAARVQPLERDAGVTLPELLGTFSLATDLGLGQPMEHVLRAWRIAARLGEHVGLRDDDRADLYYIAVLSWVGCVADTPEVAAWFGDDIAFRRDSFRVDFAGLPALAFMLRHVGAGRPVLRRVGLGAALLATGAAGVQTGLLSHCASTSALAQRLGLGPRVCDSLRQFFTRWDGHGTPAGIGGEEIRFPVRLFHLADTVEVFHRLGGVDAAVECALAGRGGTFDPRLVDAFCGVAGEIVEGSAEEPDLHETITVDPRLQQRLVGPALDEALEAVGDFTDLRSTFRAGHSRAVARLAGRAAEISGLPATEVDTVRRAGFVHDVGLHGSPQASSTSRGP